MDNNKWMRLGACKFGILSDRRSVATIIELLADSQEFKDLIWRCAHHSACHSHKGDVSRILTRLVEQAVDNAAEICADIE